jgi:F-type H+-transporting ATPase subunit a
LQVEQTMIEQAHEVQAQAHEAAGAAAATAEKFNAGETIIGHVANSSSEHPLIHLPRVFGIDFSVTKHVLMVWLVGLIVFLVVTSLVRRYLKQKDRVPTGGVNVLEFFVEFLRDTVIEPNLGKKYVKTWAPLLLTFFFFILTANMIGLIPIFEVVGLLDHYVLHTSEHSFLKSVMHGGTTATANFNVTVALAIVTFFAIIIAGVRKHGFVEHWKNIVPKGLATPIYFLLVPLEVIGMLIRPFTLTMRLAANMVGGHIAILAILSFVFIFTELFSSSVAGMGVGFGFSLPLAVAVSGLEIIVVLVQAYVFTLLSAVFIGMAIHAHH